MKSLLAFPGGHCQLPRFSTSVIFPLDPALFAGGGTGDGVVDSEEREEDGWEIRD